MFSSKLSSTISKLEEEFRKAEIKKKYNLLVLSPTLGKARPIVKKQTNYFMEYAIYTRNCCK